MKAASREAALWADGEEYVDDELMEGCDDKRMMQKNTAQCKAGGTRCVDRTT